jgi:hypothetical protein
MAALNFPDNPQQNDVFTTPSGVQYRYEGSKWVSIPASNTIADQALVVANAADVKADAAVVTANNADAKADSATATANSADAKATTALTTANIADANATSALTTANTASTEAAAALNAANAADSKADQAKETADNALPKSGGTMTGPITFSADQPDLGEGTEVSSTPPSNPVDGDTWWDSVSGTTYIYYQDASSSQWVEANPGSSNEGSSAESGWVSVQAYGAKGDGSDDTEAIKLAIAALPADGGYLLFPAGNYAITANPNHPFYPVNPDEKSIKLITEAGAKLNGQSGWGTIEAVFSNFAYLESWQPSLNRNVIRSTAFTNADYCLYDRYRDANYTGGLGGQVTSLVRNAVNIGANVGSVGQRKAEKAVVNTVTNNSDYANGIGAMLQAYGKGQGGVWALESNTYSNVIPATFAHRSAEFNIQGDGKDANDLRWIVDIVSHRVDLSQGYTYNQNTSYAGLHVSPGSADMKHGIIVREHSLGEYLEAAITVETENAITIQSNCINTNNIVISSDASANSSIINTTAYKGKNSAAAVVSYARALSQVIANTSGAESGSYRIDVAAGGTLETAFRLNGSVTNPLEIMVSGSLKRVTEGDADSGGTGFRVLRVPN